MTEGSYIAVKGLLQSGGQPRKLSDLLSFQLVPHYSKPMSSISSASSSTRIEMPPQIHRFSAGVVQPPPRRCHHHVHPRCSAIRCNMGKANAAVFPAIGRRLIRSRPRRSGAAGSPPLDRRGPPSWLQFSQRRHQLRVQPQAADRPKPTKRPLANEAGDVDRLHVLAPQGLKLGGKAG